MRSFSCFKPRDPFRIWSKELDKRVAIWARNFDSSFKLLLLGPAGAGKTTIMKQMKIIHFEGFTLEERQQKAKEIRANLLESVRELTACITASGHQIDWCDKENQMRLNFINGLNLDDQTYDIYAAKIYDYSKRILTDKGVEELFAKLNQLSITHRSQYLLHRVDEIRNVNYIPNNDDILQSRRKTSDIQKLEFQVNLPVKSGPSIKQTFCMFDVGGQRGERRKWIQVFDGVSAVMFLIDSSSFDAIDDENGRNKLKETINLFYEVWTTRFLLNSNFVLLFNKQDILKEKIERGIRIEDHFPEYKLYKFQPTIDRRRSGSSNNNSSSSASNSNSNSANNSANNNNNRSEKLNLFRTTSGRSTRSGSTVAPPTTPPIAPISPKVTTTKRKSASMYLFGRGSSSKSSSKALKWPNKEGGDQQQQQQQQILRENSATTLGNSRSGCSSGTSTHVTTTTTTTTTTARKTTTTRTTTTTPRPSEFHDAAALESAPVDGGRHSETHAQDAHNHCLQQQDQNQQITVPPPLTTTSQMNTTSQQQQQQHDKETANHYAYLKARSFIRDKFLQVTRQVHIDHEQRKFSTPNLPLYNTSGGVGGGGGVGGVGGGGTGGTFSKASSPKVAAAAAAAAATTRIDCPKRNVCYHYTTATDTENIRDLFENLQKMVLKSTMKDLV